MERESMGAETWAWAAEVASSSRRARLSRRSDANLSERADEVHHYHCVAGHKCPVTMSPFRRLTVATTTT